jgi:RNA polymerase sigma-70 factor (ECF subfamily)
MEKHEETELIRRFQAGDEDAFRLLLDPYRSLMVGSAHLMTRDHGLAEDAVQDALIQIWQALPRFRTRGSFRAWLMRILINEVNMKRRKKRLPISPLDEASHVPDNQGDVEEAVITNEIRVSVIQALELLPENQKTVVVLRYYGDLTIPEIAKAVQWTEGTVKSRLHRALQRLESIIDVRDINFSLG